MIEFLVVILTILGTNRMFKATDFKENRGENIFLGIFCYFGPMVILPNWTQRLIFLGMILFMFPGAILFEKAVRRIWP